LANCTRVATRVVAAAHPCAQGEQSIGLRHERLEAVAVGAQHIGQQIGIRGIALGAVAPVARPGCLDGVGVDRHHCEAGLDKRVDQQARGPLDGQRRRAEASQTALELGKPGGVMGDLGARPRRRCSSTTHIACVRLAQSSPAK
jgi:hypothetical protein